MIREILKPRSYESVEQIKKGEYGKGTLGITAATITRSMVAFVGMKAAQIDTATAAKASVAGNIAITASIFIYYMFVDA